MRLIDCNQILFYHFISQLQGLQTALKWKLVVGESCKMEHMKADNTSLPNKQLNFQGFWI